LARHSIAAAVLAALVLPTAAAAQEAAPLPAQRTVSASGIGRALVAKPAKRNEASVRAVVDAADRAAEREAIRVASARAANFAAGTGLTLGPLFRVDEGDLGVFGSLVFAEAGGDEDDGIAPFCRPRERYDRRRRRRIARTTCVVPEARQAIVRLTYTVVG
jgi:hypothetical protein